MSNTESNQQIEDRFFSNLEEDVYQRLVVEAQSREGRAELLRSTGITDAQLVDELVDLGVTARGLMAMRLIPLVLVAWASDRVDDEERECVLAEARKLGIRESTTAYVLIDHWLRQLPPGECVGAWRQYMTGILGRMSRLAHRKFLSSLESQMVSVAEASGGLGRIGSVSKEERQMIDGLLSLIRNSLEQVEKRND